MSILYIDGFDHYNVAGATNYIYTASPSRWTAAGVDVSGSSCIATMPVLGGKCMNVVPRSNSPSNGLAGRPVLLMPIAPASGLTFGCGFHFYATSLDYPSSPSFNRQALIGFSAGAAVVTRCIALDSGGQFTWRTTPEGTSLGNSGANVLAAGVLYHIEVKILWHASAGTVEIRVNGAVYMSLTGIATLPTSATHMMFATAAWEGSGAAIGTFSYDNLFIWDATGAINNTFQGERNVQTIFPNADTADADWALSTGAAGWSLLDNVPAVVGTDYIESSTVTDTSVFDLTSLANPNITVVAVQTDVYAEKTDAGASQIQVGVVSGGVDSMSAGQSVTQSQYRNFLKVTELNPNTGIAWTAAEINAAQIKLVRST